MTNPCVETVPCTQAMGPVLGDGSRSAASGGLVRSGGVRPCVARPTRTGQTAATMHVTSDQLGYESPEAAALAGWASTPGADARVVSVAVRGDRAEFVIDTDPAYLDYVYCPRRNGRWFEVVSGNAPTTGWDRPATLDWR